jgi:chitin disaccharide deacetylase
MSGIRLVTRADDAGMHPAANRAIRDTVVHGVVRNISLMAPAPAIRNAFEYLGDLGDRADFGLHVTLTAEWETLRWRPLTTGRSGGFVRGDGTMCATVPELLSLDPDPDAMIEEVVAQYDLLTGMGFALSYFDVHMGADALPGLAERLEAFANDRGLVSNRALFASGSLVRLPAWNGPGEHPGTELADHLAQVAAGTYLLVGHPVVKDESFLQIRLDGQPGSDVMIERNRQRRMFMDMEIVDYCENVGIDLLRYTQVGAATRS